MWLDLWVESLRVWTTRRRAHRDLRGLASATRGPFMLRVESGTPVESPMTGAYVLAYRVELGFIKQVKELVEVKLIGEDRYRIYNEFHPSDELAESPAIVLASRDDLRVHLAAGSYRLEDDAHDGAMTELDSNHVFRDRLGRAPSHSTPGYRFYSLSEGQILLIEAELVQVERGSAYRGGVSHDCDFELRPLGDQPIRIIDQIGLTSL